MPARPNDTRERMVDATILLLRRQGLNGTGLLQVLQEAAAPRGSLYFHFPGGKEQLVEEAVRTARGRISQWIQRSLDEHPLPGDVVRDMAERYARRLERSEFHDGCPVAAVALEGGPVSERLRLACEAALDEWAGMLASRMVAHGREAGESVELARTVFAAFEGALMMARASRTAEPLRQVGRTLGALVDPAASLALKRTERRRPVVSGPPG